MLDATPILIAVDAALIGKDTTLTGEFATLSATQAK